MKRWWVPIALLLSLGLNVGVLATLAVQRAAALRTGPGEPPPPNARQLERVADRVGVEGPQRRRFVELHRTFFGTLRRGRREVSRQRAELRRDIAAATPDRARITRRLADLHSAEAALEDAFVEHVLAVRELLDGPQERAYLRILARLRPLPEGAGARRHLDRRRRRAPRSPGG